MFGRSAARTYLTPADTACPAISRSYHYSRIPANITVTVKLLPEISLDKNILLALPPPYPIMETAGVIFVLARCVSAPTQLNIKYCPARGSTCAAGAAHNSPHNTVWPVISTQHALLFKLLSFVHAASTVSNVTKQVTHNFVK